MSVKRARCSCGDKRRWDCGWDGACCVGFLDRKLYDESVCGCPTGRLAGSAGALVLCMQRVCSSEQSPGVGAANPYFIVWRRAMCFVVWDAARHGTGFVCDSHNHNHKPAQGATIDAQTFCATRQLTNLNESGVQGSARFSIQPFWQRR